VLNISGDLVDSKNTVNSLYIASGTNYEEILSGDKRLKMSLGDFKEEITIGNKTLDISSGNIERTIQAGNIEDTISTGDKELTIGLGSKRITIDSGSIEESISTGDKKINVSVGNYQLEIGTGDITVKTSVGSVTISGSSDVNISGLTVTNEASTQNLVKAGGVVLIDSPLIQLGNGATQPVPKGFELLSYLASHTHIHPMGPTGPPIITPPIGMLSTATFVK